MKIFRRILLALVLVLSLAAIATYFFLRSSLPDYNRQLVMPGLSAPVEVIYDSFAIPHIYAQNEDDLFQALGYVHAQDRLFQMEVLRRLADGRLSEVFGEKALESDKFFRTLSFRAHAKMTIDSLYRDSTKPFVRAARAYLRGLNEYIRSGKTPYEFTITGMPKTPFTEEDMEIIVGYMGYTFVGAFRTEAVATAIAARYGNRYLQEVMSNWPDSVYTIPVAAGERQADSSAARVLGDIAGAVGRISEAAPFAPFLGSNGWAISGRKTQSGKPILSNDTHIAFAQPSVWYEAYLECPGFNIYGNFLAGTPVPALGHSDKGGWGLTMFENDDADFYTEKPNPSNPNQVWYQDHWEDLQVRREIIRVKGKPDHVLEVKQSRHGYIMNGAFDQVKDFKVPVALWWVFHRFPARHLEVFYNISHARDVHDAAKAVEPLTSPGLNFMWADTAGNIGWWAAGKLPVRPPHVNPALILDGSTGKDDPLGWLPFAQNPQIINPARGVLYTANNQPADMGSGLVPGYYVPSNRARRIEELLFTDKRDWTEASVRAVINDVQVPTYPAVLKKVLPLIDQSALTGPAKSAYEILLAWDGRHDLESVAPTVYYKFIHETYQQAFLDELGPELMRNFEQTMSLKRNTASFLQNDSSGWWDNVHTTAKEQRKDMLTAALNKAAEAISRQLGPDPGQWQWKKVHSLEHKHPLGILPVVGKWFNVGPIPVNGGQETLNNLDFSLDSTGLYPVKSGPALRRIVDFTTPRRAFSVNPTGQSGHFMSRHYDDQAKMFAEGGRRPEHVDRAVLNRVKIAKMVLKPGN